MMSGLFESLVFSEAGLMNSMCFQRVANLLCLVGSVLAVISLLAHQRAASRVVAALPGGGSADIPVGDLSGGDSKLSSHWSHRGVVLALAGAIGMTFLSVWNRYIEVNHFPSQTMSEVLVMFGFALLVSMFVLHFALRWKDHGPGWAIVDDVLLLCVFVGVWLTNYYSTSLSTAQRDLPPALQSYWFAPHLAALIFSYATLAIAGVICLVYFSIRFWSVLVHGGKSVASQFLILAVLLLLPFGHLVTIPVLLLVGAVLFIGSRRGTGFRVPGTERVGEMEKVMDKVSFRAFAVGFPFLTAGLWMGAFWAQEAWANYWGWDSKENSALITWLVYVVYIHLRMLGGYKGERSMGVLMGGALSVFMTFQLFGYLPDSQKSLHRYTDDGVTPMEGMQGAAPTPKESAKLERGEGEGR